MSNSGEDESFNFSAHENFSKPCFKSKFVGGQSPYFIGLWEMWQ